MGGCCCHNDDTKDEDQEEACIIVKNEEPQSPRKEYMYGSLSTTEDKNEIVYEEPQEPDRLHEQHSSTYEAAPQSEDEQELSEAHSPTNDESQISISLQETPATCSNHEDTCEDISVHEDVAPKSPVDDLTQGEVDREIDQLVAAAMAAKVIYPPNATQEETSLSQSAGPSPQATQEPTSDRDADSDQEAIPTKRVSLMKKTQMSLKRVKARASSLASLSKHSSGEQIEKQRRSLQEKTTKKSGLNESTSEKDTQKTLYAKKDSREETQTASYKSELKRKKGFIPGQQMKSNYAKGRVAKFEVERDVRDKLASHRSAVDPRKVALERGERLGQLDDTIDKMRDHSSSFAQVAHQLKEEQRGRTSTFPW